MKKYPKTKYPNHEEAEATFAEGDIVIMEKLDGANFRWTHEDNLDEEYQTSDRDIVFGSRNVEYKNQQDEKNQFDDQIEYIREVVNPKRLKELEHQFGGSLTFFGEAMVPHTLTYNWDETPPVVGFDVYNEDEERWLPYGEMRFCFEHLNLTLAPVLDIITAEAWRSDDYEIEVPESEYGDVEAEGFMFKNYSTQTFSKFVRDDFKEKNKKTFGKPKKHQETGAEKLSYRYITNARIEKNAHKMIDEGPYESLQMEMMGPKGDHPGLPEKVIRDMAEEESGNIFMSENWEVDIADFRSVTSSRCANVLRRMINERAAEKIQ